MSMDTKKLMMYKVLPFFSHNDLHANSSCFTLTFNILSFQLSVKQIYSKEKEKKIYNEKEV